MFPNMSPEQKKAYDEAAKQVALEDSVVRGRSLGELLTAISAAEQQRIREAQRRHPWLALKQRIKSFFKHFIPN